MTYQCICGLGWRKKIDQKLQHTHFEGQETSEARNKKKAGPLQVGQFNILKIYLEIPLKC